MVSSWLRLMVAFSLPSLGDGGNRGKVVGERVTCREHARASHALVTPLVCVCVCWDMSYRILELTSF